MSGGVSHAIGFVPGEAQTAFAGMRQGGGHAIRHLQRAGLIPNVGSLQYRVAAFERLITPVLERPRQTFNWRVGTTAAKGFAGIVGRAPVVVFVAREGPYQGRILTAVLPDANQIAMWGLQT